jgi:hypothetical protein
MFSGFRDQVIGAVHKRRYSGEGSDVSRHTLQDVCVSSSIYVNKIILKGEFKF